MKSLRFTILSIALTGVMTAVAQQQVSASPQPTDTLYSLEECTAMALANNASLRSADNSLRAAIETRREAFTKYFPEIAAGASAFKTNTDVLQYDVLDLFTIGIIDKGKAAGVWAVQPVFAGGRIVNGNKLARVGEEAARLRREQTADQVRVATERLYWKLVTLKASRHTLESAITMLDTLQRQVKVAVDAGVAMPNDLLKVDLKLNSFKADMVDLDNGIELVGMLLGQAMGLGVDRHVDVDAVVPDSVPPYPSAIYLSGDEALGLTVDHQLLIRNVEAKKLEKRMEVGSYLPQVGVAAGWFYHNIFDQNHNFGGVMVNVNVPISGWWGGSHAIRRKSLELDNARIELADLSQKLRIEMADKWDNLTAAHRKMSLAAEAIAQSAENLRLNKAYYEAGMSTVTDLLDAQTLNREASDNYIAAYGAFRVSQAEYLNATGR